MSNGVGGELIWASAEILRPLVWQLLALGVPFGGLEARLRELFVEVAAAEFALPGRRQTDSRVALLTGINRKEVRRIRSASGQKGRRSFTMNCSTSVISRWLTDRDTVDRTGRPRPLPYSAKRGASFMKLARKVTADLAPGVLLAELVRAGAVEVQVGNVVVLRTDTYMPKQQTAEMVQILAEDPPELIATILRNIFGTADQALLQRKVYFDNLGSDAATQIRRQMRREGERFLHRVNQLLARHDRDRNPQAAGGERYYAGMGVYFFETPVIHAQAAPVVTRRKRTKERKR